MNPNTPNCDHKHEFSCVQYNFPEAMAERIMAWGKQYIPDDILYQPAEDDSYGREDNIHCTVFFGLHTESATPILYLLEQEQPFLIRLGQISCFSNEKYDVIKVEAHSPDLMRLHEKLGTCLASTECYNSYRPHVTIAYVKKGEGKKFVGDRTFERITLRAETLCFSSRTGSRCRIRLAPLKRIPVYV